MLIQRARIPWGSTGNKIQIPIKNSTTANGLTGLLFNTASLTCYYMTDVATASAAVTLATMTLGTYTSGGFIEVDATHMPGVYEFCPPDTVIATANATRVTFVFQGATNMEETFLQVDLTQVNDWDGVHFGLTALPAFLPGTPQGLPVVQDGTGGVAVSNDATAGITADVVAAVLVTPANKLTTDASGRVTLTPAEHTLVSGTDVPAALTAQGYTTGRAPNLDNLNATVSSRATQAQIVSGSTAITVDTSGRVRLQPTGMDDIATADVVSDADARTNLPKMLRAVFDRLFDRNQVTASAHTVSNDAGTIIMTMAVSDDGTTFTKNKSS